MTTTGSAAIADELRRRIESGRLAPGERVPSTRAITREWGVAIATASRALAVLAADGLVRPVPGVGTVVTGPASPGPAVPGRRVPGPVAGGEAPWARSSVPAVDHPAPDEVLTPARIVAAAMAVADAEGLDGVSMRGVAARLGVVPMALYRHVRDKDDLLGQMCDAALAQWRPPTGAPVGWRARIEPAVQALWSTFRRHPWLAQVSPARRGSTPAYSEWILTALAGEGLEPAEAHEVHLALLSCVRGAATGPATEPRVDVDAVFRRGLGLFLDGLGLQIDRRTGATRSSAPPWLRS